MPLHVVQQDKDGAITRALEIKTTLAEEATAFDAVDRLVCTGPDTITAMPVDPERLCLVGVTQPVSATDGVRLDMVVLIPEAYRVIGSRASLFVGRDFMNGGNIRDNTGEEVSSNIGAHLPPGPYYLFYPAADCSDDIVVQPFAVKLAEDGSLWIDETEQAHRFNSMMPAGVVLEEVNRLRLPARLALDVLNFTQSSYPLAQA